MPANPLLAVARVSLPWVIAIILLLLALALVWPYFRAMRGPATEKESARSEVDGSGDVVRGPSYPDPAMAGSGGGQASLSDKMGAEGLPWRESTSGGSTGIQNGVARASATGAKQGEGQSAGDADMRRERQSIPPSERVATTRTGLRALEDGAMSSTKKVRDASRPSSGPQAAGEPSGTAKTSSASANQAAGEDEPIAQNGASSASGGVLKMTEASKARSPMADERLADEKCDSLECTSTNSSAKAAGAKDAAARPSGAIEISGDWNGQPVRADRQGEDVRISGGGLSRVIRNVPTVDSMFCVAYDSGQLNVVRTDGDGRRIEYNNLIVAQARNQEEASYLLEHARNFRLVCRTASYLTEQDPAFVNQYWIP